MKLTTLGKKSCFQKKIELEGAELTVDVTIYKATKTKETAIISVMKKKVGDILPPYVPYKEDISRKSTT